MNNKIVIQMAWAFVLCVCGGCKSGTLPATSSNSYKLNVDFFLGPHMTRKNVEVVAHPGVPFGVKTHDEAGNRYEVSGTLWQETEERFQIRPRTIEMHYTDGVSSFGCSGRDAFQLELGKGVGCMGVNGVVVDGYEILLTRE